MPLWDYVQYSSGYVPYADATAQKRCFNYLVEAIGVLDRKVAETGSQNAKNLRTMFEDIRHMVKNSEGSRNLNKANNFWRYWDRNKRRIIQIVEDTDDEFAFQDKMGELEDGRYIQE